MDVLLILSDPSNLHRVEISKEISRKLSERCIVNEIRAVDGDHGIYSEGLEAAVIIALASPGGYHQIPHALCIQSDGHHSK
jgi:hypothetical protein